MTMEEYYIDELVAKKAERECALVKINSTSFIDDYIEADRKQYKAYGLMHRPVSKVRKEAETFRKELLKRYEAEEDIYAQEIKLLTKALEKINDRKKAFQAVDTTKNKGAN